MKKFYKRILVVSLSFVLCLGLSSCDSVVESSIEETTASINNSNPYILDSVASLKAAIKRNLSMYENKRITITGTIVKRDSSIILSDIAPTKDNGGMFRFDALKMPNITIIFQDDKTTVLLDSGDYVKIFGTVKISNSEIYLDDCEYEIIKSIYD